MSRLLWMAAQAYAVWWMTAGMIRDMGWEGAAGYLAINIMIVAFMTAVIVNLWDWLRTRLTGLPFRFGFALARLVSGVRDR
ncbi:hypothetical protein [uncultured Methylobacterium sp.]|jgi:hypothetical protein|uniref:hypothetical protein n=1 Tax=uncultured Methylobacterium sp. TaxID=157278 RepID=UPI00262236D2|nr:hypothetical protein [uncultured Methylobacterium sp.]